jgi:hypothetical protein
MLIYTPMTSTDRIHEEYIVDLRDDKTYPQPIQSGSM